MDWDNTPVYLKTKELQNKELSTDDQILAKEFKKAEKWMKRIRDESNRNLGYIHTVKEVAEKLQFCTQTILNMIDKDQSEDILKREFDLIKQGTEYLFQKDSLYKFISKNSNKYVNGIELPCNYDRLPEYYKIEQCAEILKLENRRRFKYMLDNTPEKLDGVEILKIGNQKRIEKQSFQRYADSVKKSS